MRFLQVIFGLITFVLGMGLSLVAAAGFSMGDRPLAIVVGFISLLLIVIGLKWIRGGRKMSWRDDPASYRQKSFADELGISYGKHVTKGELSDMISEVKGR
jgi:hypothetical protein